MVFGLNKWSSINFWMKFDFYYLPVPGWWNDLIVICQIVLKWVLQRSCSLSVIVEPVCSITAPAVYLVFFIFWYVCEHLIVWYPVWLFKLLTLFYCWWIFVKIYKKSVWTILKAAFLMFVPAVAANEFARDKTIPYLGD